ncbi:histidine kinase [Nonomuraea sp. NPDC005983]|uniref:sensor histidine kinase n=1 Tax=Nonomuraea sp. NPDC005983 TaxID=3155595 RepID=UPI0033B8090B
MPEHHLAAPDGKPYEAPGRTSFLVLMLLGIAAVWETVDGTFQPAWLSWAGLAAVGGLHTLVTLSAFRQRLTVARTALAALATVVLALSATFGGGWYYVLPLLGVAISLVLSGRAVRVALVALAVVTGLIVRLGGGSIESIMAFSWGTFNAGLVVAGILHLHAVIGELRETRRRLAEAAVAEERLRFSRDLHDLLGHTLSVIVVKAEAVRRLAGRDPEQAQRQASDIEAVGRQALTEVREAVTGYRGGSLAAELDRAHDALKAAGVELAVHRTGTAPAPPSEALLGWVVREGVTNIIRHSGATRAEIRLDGQAVTVRDNGTAAATASADGSGLRGLAERLSQAGGHVEAGPLPEGGFQLTASLPPTA